ncbi:phage/plasmid primase, P4 family [Sphingomonas sp.]|uniref:phage/plasmid primase, P4 family n=1 Tax=Sphingomonas sp. TaxID=28214 RepID=UPI002D80D4B6|nr:phage/plasmid primase, P4 family [Sphingomonas sp.]HEU0045231.1 phage/plasmid primase, P4 family [Sphingomonas sp.]
MLSEADSKASAGGEPAGATSGETQSGFSLSKRQKQQNRGSFSEGDPERPPWTATTRVVAEYDYVRADGTYACTIFKGQPKAFLKGRRFTGGHGALDLARRDDPHAFYNFPGLEAVMKGAGDNADVPYRLPELIADLSARPDDIVHICEGEKDTDTVREQGQIATTNPNGAKGWRSEYNRWLRGRRVAILTDNDDNGRERGRTIRAALRGFAASVVLVELPGLPVHGDVTDWLEAGRTAADLMAEVERQMAAAGAGENADDLPPSEHAVAVEFTRRYGGELLFDHDSGSWYLWDDSRWRPERTGLAFEQCRRIAAAGEGGRAMQKASVAAGAERFARSDRAHAVESACWDSDPMLAATPGGPTIDLRTGTTRAPNPADRITKVLGFVPEPEEPELWLRCLREWTGGDEELVQFLQQFLGYSLTGLTVEHALLFLFGSGGNGKSVFLNIVLAVMGEYSMTAGMETFTASKSERHTTELARLRGARVVTGSEVEEGKEFNSARIKQATGGDPITARFMRQNDFTYIPQFKLLFTANDQPRLHQVDDAMKRRINMIPFLHKPPNPDPFLEQKLRAEGGRILSWMIAGCLDWQRRRAEAGGSGLHRPDAVKAATADYFEGQDVFGQWIEERCALGPNRQAQSADLYRSWVLFAQRVGEEPGTQTAFGLRLGKKFSKGKPGGKRGFLGIALGTSDNEEAM